MAKVLRVETDLFSSDGFLDSPTLLRELAQKKLKKSVPALKKQGWAWVEVMASGDIPSTASCKYVTYPSPLMAGLDKSI